jgi:hypothetical protein
MTHIGDCAASAPAGIGVPSVEPIAGAFAMLELVSKAGVAHLPAAKGFRNNHLQQ